MSLMEIMSLGNGNFVLAAVGLWYAEEGKKYHSFVQCILAKGA
jgi:hypothetical protein